MIRALPSRAAATVVALALFVAAASASTVEWSTLTSTELAALPVSDFKTATSTNIGDIPYDACSGFQADQLAALSATALAGMSAWLWLGSCALLGSGKGWSLTRVPTPVLCIQLATVSATPTPRRGHRSRPPRWRSWGTRAST